MAIDWKSLPWDATYGAWAGYKPTSSDGSDSYSDLGLRLDPFQTQALASKLGWTGNNNADQLAAGLVQDRGYEGWGSSPIPANDSARDWLVSQGYQPGLFNTGKNAWAYGLLDKNGKYVEGQPDPQLVQGDSIADYLGMVAMMLPAVGGIIGAAGAAAGGAGAGASALADVAPEVIGAGSSGIGEGISALGAGGTDVAALGSAWSPQALGLTQVAPTAIDAGALTVPTLASSDAAALCGNAGYGAGMTGAQTSAFDSILNATGSSSLANLGSSPFGQGVTNGALRGGLTGGVKAIATGQDPIKGALGGAVSGAIGGGITGGVNTFNPDGGPIVNGAISGGIKAGVGGGNPLAGAIGGGLGGIGSISSGLGSLVNGGGQTQSNGGNVSLLDFLGGDSGDDDYTGLMWNMLDQNKQDNQNWLDQFGIGGTDSLGSINPGNFWNYLDNKDNSSWLGSLVNSLGGSQKTGALLGGLLGAASSHSGTMTASKVPWAPAQPFLMSLLGDTDKLRQQYAANPFTPQQTQAYQQAYDGLNQARAAFPGLLSFGQNAMNGAYNFQMPRTFQGLLGGSPPSQTPAQMPPTPTMSTMPITDPGRRA